MNEEIVDILMARILENPPYSWFPSSEQVVSEIISRADIQPRDWVLDVCAGDGRLGLAARELGARVEAIEIEPRFRQILFQQGLVVVGADVFQSEPKRLYDVVLSNPPFSFSPENRGVDLAIIQHAYRCFLASGGCLVSVVSASHKYAKCPKAEAFRAWMQQVEAELVDLPLEAFWGTVRPVTVESWLVVARK